MFLRAKFIKSAYRPFQVRCRKTGGGGDIAHFAQKKTYSAETGNARALQIINEQMINNGHFKNR